MAILDPGVFHHRIGFEVTLSMEIHFLVIHQAVARWLATFVRHDQEPSITVAETIAAGPKLSPNTLLFGSGLRRERTSWDKDANESASVPVRMAFW